MVSQAQNPESPRNTQNHPFRHAQETRGNMLVEGHFMGLGHNYQKHVFYPYSGGYQVRFRLLWSPNTVFPG